jgi:hypothetical protein
MENFTLQFLNFSLLSFLQLTPINNQYPFKCRNALLLTRDQLKIILMKKILNKRALTKLTKDIYCKMKEINDIY